MLLKLSLIRSPLINALLNRLKILLGTRDHPAIVQRNTLFATLVFTKMAKQ